MKPDKIVTMNQSSFNGLRSREVTPKCKYSHCKPDAVSDRHRHRIFWNRKSLSFFHQQSRPVKVPHFLFVSLSVSGIISYMFCPPSRLVMFNVLNLCREDYVKHFQNVIAWSNFLCTVFNSVTLSQMLIDRQHCVLRPFNRRMTPSNVKFIITG